MLKIFLLLMYFAVLILSSYIKEIIIIFINLCLFHLLSFLNNFIQNIPIERRNKRNLTNVVHLTNYINNNNGDRLYKRSYKGLSFNIKSKLDSFIFPIFISTIISFNIHCTFCSRSYYILYWLYPIVTTNNLFKL